MRNTPTATLLTAGAGLVVALLALSAGFPGGGKAESARRLAAAAAVDETGVQCEAARRAAARGVSSGSQKRPGWNSANECIAALFDPAKAEPDEKNPRLNPDNYACVGKDVILVTAGADGNVHELWAASAQIPAGTCRVRYEMSPSASPAAGSWDAAPVGLTGAMMPEVSGRITDALQKVFQAEIADPEVRRALRGTAYDMDEMIKYYASDVAPEIRASESYQALVRISSGIPGTVDALIFEPTPLGKAELPDFASLDPDDDEGRGSGETTGFSGGQYRTYREDGSFADGWRLSQNVEKQTWGNWLNAHLYYWRIGVGDSYTRLRTQLGKTWGAYWGW